MDSNVFMEILSYCPIKSVDRFKTVSKEWNKLMHDPYFLQLHSKRSETVSGFFVQGRSRCKYVSSFVPVDVNDESSKTVSLDFFRGYDTAILATSSSGLMCVVSGNTRGDTRRRRYYICKPATKQFRALPNPRIRHTTAKVALVVLSSKPLHYKIVRLSEPCKHKCIVNKSGVINVYRCEVFDSDTWTWKRKEDIILPHCSFFLTSPLSASGKLYWQTTNDDVLEFDEVLETHQVFPLQKLTCEGKYGKKKLTKHEGKLAFICETCEGFYEIWVCNDMVWEKKFTMDMNRIVKKEPFCPPQSFTSIEVALINGGIYNSMFNKFPKETSMEKYPSSGLVMEQFSFTSDFEEVSFTGGRKITV